MSASISVVLMVVPPGWMTNGCPPVNARFWSNSLKPFVRDRKIHIVKELITFGIVTLKSVCMEVAPSIRAASRISPGTFCSPAT